MKISSYNTEVHTYNIPLISLLVSICKKTYKMAFESVFEFFSTFVKTDNCEICTLPVINEAYYR